MKAQLTGQMIDILNPGKVSKWKVRFWFGRVVSRMTRDKEQMQ